MDRGLRITCVAGLGLILGAYWLFARGPATLDSPPPVESGSSPESSQGPDSLPDPVLAPAPLARSEPEAPGVGVSPPRIHADPAAPRPQLRIRLLRADRSPIVDTEVGITREENRAGRSTSVGSRARTDGFGMLRFDWTEFLAGSIRSVGFQAPAVAPEHQGAIDLSRALALDEDLGELVLKSIPLFASGIVLDEFGRGVKDAQVYVVSRTGGFGSPLTWVENEETTRRTAADGTFRLVAENLWGDVFALAAKHPELGVAERVEFQPGATGIELRLMRCATVSGSVVLPSGLPSAMLQASLLAPDEFEGSFAAPRTTSKVSDDGRFEMRDVLPGTYRFVLTGNHPRTLLSIADIVITRPPFAQDPRLQEIPLGMDVKALRVEIVDASGKPIESVLMVRERGWESSIGAFQVETGVFVVPDLPAGQDLLITAPGYQPVWRKDVRSDANPTLRIVLAPALRRTFVFEGDYPLRSGGRRIAVVLTPSPALVEARNECLLGIESRSGEIGAGRSVTLSVPFPGEYELNIAVRDGEGIFAVDQTIESHALTIDGQPTGVISVVDSAILRSALDG